MAKKKPPAVAADDLALLRQILDRAPAVFWSTDEELRFTSSLGAGLVGLNLHPQQVNGVSLYEFFGTDDDHFPAIAAHHRALKGENTAFCQQWAGNAYQAHVMPLRNARGAISGCIGVAIDVSELKREEEEARNLLNHSEARLKSEVEAREQTAEELTREQKFNQHIVESAPNLIVAIAPDGTTLRVNPAVETVTGYQPQELIGRNWWKIFYPGESYAQVEQLFAAFERGAVANYDMELTVKDGTQRTISWNSVNRFDRRGHLAEIVGVGVDVSQRKHLEQTLVDRQRLLKRLLEVYDRDRRLISLEMHDGMVQQMTGAVMHLQGIEPVVRKNPDRVERELARAIELLREAVEEARRVMSGLRPPVLDDLGVVAAIEYLVSEARCDVEQVELINKTEFGRLAPPLENTIFRIAQEAITNFCRHSGTSKALVELTETPEFVTLKVRDWGHGFEPAKVPLDRFGLAGIRERAGLLNARATIRSKLGQGTTIEVRFPKIEQLD